MRRNNVGRNETMVDIIRFSISRVSLCIPGLAYFSRRFYRKLWECSGEMNKRICGSFSGALFNTKVGEEKREVIKLHLQIMSRSHIWNTARIVQPLVYFRAEAPLIIRAYYITQLYLSSCHHYVLHCAVFLSLSLSWTVSLHVSLHSEQEIAASKKWFYRP